MKMMQIMKSDKQPLCVMIAAFIVLSFGGCKDTDPAVEAVQPFDPSRPVVVSDFNPKSGGMGQRLVIYGENFGDDPEKVSVFIGGKEAKVINVRGESLYCLVPRQAFNGDIEVRVSDDSSQVNGNLTQALGYQRKLVV